MCRNWGHGVHRGPGDPTGYGPGRRINWDRIMSHVRHGHVIKCIVVPAVPIHFAIEVGNGDIEVFDVGAHNLPWCTIRVAKAFVPMSQPVFFNGVAR